jgi:hypothetical protein
MTTERDPRTRTVLSWLREDLHENAERVLLRALDIVDTTPQRRSWWPAWRSEQMRTTQILVAAAAVLAVAVLGYSLLPGLSGPGQPSSVPPTPTPSPTVLQLPQSGPLTAGTYRIGGPTFTNQPLTLTVPSGWTHHDGNFIAKGDAFEGTGVTLATWIVSHVYADSCDWEGMLEPVDSAASVVAALVAQRGHDTSEPAATTVGGQPATRLVLSLPAPFDIGACASSIARLWPDAGPQEQFGLPIFPGQTTVVHVVDHGDSVTLVVSVRNDDSPQADVQEMNDVLASIAFEP